MLGSSAMIVVQDRLLKFKPRIVSVDFNDRSISAQIVITFRI